MTKRQLIEDRDIINLNSTLDVLAPILRRLNVLGWSVTVEYEGDEYWRVRLCSEDAARELVRVAKVLGFKVDGDPAVRNGEQEIIITICVDLWGHDK